jgi:multiple sugar transport system permease protein
MTRWREGLSVSTKQAMWAWAFLAIPILFFVVVRFAPSLYAFGLAFTSWNIVGTPRYVGFENFERLWNDPVFWQAFKNTFRYLILGVPVSLVLSFVIAYYLDQVRFMHGFIRALYFVPFLTTAAAMAWVWKWLYQPLPIGYFNKFLNLLAWRSNPS